MDIQLTEVPRGVDKQKEDSDDETQNLVGDAEDVKDRDVKDQDDDIQEIEEGAEEGIDHVNGNTCHICLKELGGCDVAVLKCEHIYHFSCIVAHLHNGYNYCIICDKPLAP